MLDAFLFIVSLWSNFLIVGLAVFFIGLILTAFVTAIQTKYKTLGLFLMIPSGIIFGVGGFALQIGMILGIMNLVLVLL